MRTVLKDRNTNYSVAMCTFNGATFVTDQLISILNQTIKPKEIVIYDDNSTDNTYDVIKSIADSHKTIKWNIHKNYENIGYIKNFQQAILKCEHDYVFLADQDDVWVKDKAHKLLSLLHKKDCYVVFSDAKLTDESLNELGLNMFDVINFTKIHRKLFYINYHGTQLLLSRFIITGATMAMRKSKICDFFPIPETPFFIHDSWIATLAKCMGKVYFIDEALILYRQHNKQSIGAYNNRNATKMSYTNKNDLLSIINSKHVREKVVLDFFRNKKTLLSNDQMKFLEMRQMLYVKLLNRPNSIIQRIKCIDPRLYFFKMPEFYTIRMFAGNCCKYIFG